MSPKTIPRLVPLKDEKLFRMAMTHRSAAEDSVRDSYERLEFFGDSVLGVIVAEYLYEHHPDWDQGMMSKARSSVVQEGPLAETAVRLGLDERLILTPSEEQAGGRRRPSVLCDIFEAVVGAIYIESGLEKARWFVLEWRATPQYRVMRETGHSHEPRFLVEVLLDNEILGEGTGRTKKEAEQSAAKDALEAIDRAKRARSMVGADQDH
jgi:ribonuclease III